jgi:hypothetical protein
MEERLARLERMIAALMAAMSVPNPDGIPVAVPVNPAPQVPPGMVLTLTGRLFPEPLPGSGELFPGYTLRVGRVLGPDVEAQARRTVGSLFGGQGQKIVDKHGGDWVAAAEEHLFGDRAYNPDPAWGRYRPGGA